MNTLTQELEKLSGIPGRETSEWLSSAESAIEFLKANTRSDKLVLFASLNSVLIHAVLAPLKNLDPVDQDDLNHDFVQMDDSWIIEHVSGGGEPDRVYLAQPLRRHGKTLVDGEKLIFRRSFAGSRSSPIEISQKLVHTLDLHFMAERNAFCRLNSDGDIEDVITIFEKRDKDWTQNVMVVTILAKDFAEYMRLADMCMVFFFDFTRTRKGGSTAGAESKTSTAEILIYSTTAA